jgi:hypothetical protein
MTILVQRRAAPRRRRWLLAGVGIAVLAILGVGAALVAFRYVPALNEARSLVTDLEHLAGRVRETAFALDRPTLTGFQSDVASDRERLERLRAMLAGDPLIALARALPPSRDAVAGADAVAAAAGDILDAADAGLVLAGRYVAIRERQVAQPADASDRPTTLSGLVELMATGRGEVDAMVAALDRAAAALGSAPRDLPGPIAHARDLMQARLDEFGPTLRRYAELDDTIPAILGWEGPRRYLVLAQNPAELRATGGFIGSFGTITFDRGRITERKFQGVETLPLPLDRPYIRPPSAIIEHLFHGRLDRSWGLLDANWSPDFPTSARDAIKLYRNDGGTGQIDGVLGVTTYTIDELLKLTGPIAVPGYDVTIATGEATLKTLQQTRVPGSPGTNRKVFLSAFADRLIESLLALPPGSWTDLAASGETFQSRHLVLAWFSESEAEAVMVLLGMDGAVRSDPGDYVYPVDSNVSPVSKLSVVTSRDVQLDVRLDKSGDAQDTLTMRWTNRIEEPAELPYRELPGLETLTTLGMYFRAYVPEGSRVETVSTSTAVPLTSLPDQENEAGRKFLASYFRIPPGSTSLTYVWTSPLAAVLGADGLVTYRLTIQKQPGVTIGPLTLRITVPAGATVIDASPGLSVAGDTVTLRTSYDHDVVVVVRYRPGPEA